MGIWLMIYDESYQKIIKKLKEERKKKFTQEEFARRMETKQKTISNIENCRQQINLKYLQKACEILDIDFIEILKMYSNV